MRRIQPPTCTICNLQAARYESDVWPTLKLCIPCWQDATEYIVRTSYDHGNPLLIELLSGTDNDERDDSIRMWRRRPKTNQFYEYRVQRVTDSENKIENPLDILDDLCLDSGSLDVISELSGTPDLLTGLD